LIEDACPSETTGSFSLRFSEAKDPSLELQSNHRTHWIEYLEWETHKPVVLTY